MKTKDNQNMNKIQKSSPKQWSKKQQTHFKGSVATDPSSPAQVVYVEEPILLTPDSFKSTQATQSLPPPTLVHTKYPSLQDFIVENSSTSVSSSDDKPKGPVNLLALLAKKDTSSPCGTSATAATPQAVETPASPCERPPSPPTKLPKPARKHSSVLPSSDFLEPKSSTALLNSKSKTPVSKVPSSSSKPVPLQRQPSPRKCARDRTVSSPPKPVAVSTSPPPSDSRWAGVSSPAPAALPIPSFSEQQTPRSRSTSASKLAPTQLDFSSVAEPQQPIVSFAPSAAFPAYPPPTQYIVPPPFSYAPTHAPFPAHHHLGPSPAPVAAYSHSHGFLHPFPPAHVPTPAPAPSVQVTSDLDLLSQQLKQMLTINS